MVAMMTRPIRADFYLMRGPALVLCASAGRVAGMEDEMGTTFQLDEAQLRAAHHPAREGVTVVAGPGAGKTAVIAERVAWMVREGIATPGQIVCVTFTRAMAADLRRRIAERMGDVVIRCRACNGAGRVNSSIGLLMDCSECCGVGRTEVAGIECGTLHSLAGKWVRQAIKGQIAGGRHILTSGYLDAHSAEDFRIAMPWEVDAAVDEAARSLGKRTTKRALRDGLDRMGRENVETWEPMYEARRILRSRNLLRFDDLTALAVRIVKCHGDDCKPISAQKPFLVVDEAQDMRCMSAAIVNLWLGPVTRVGDDAQAIYGFLGESGVAFLPHGDPSAHLLGANYRATSSVAAFGAKLRTGLAALVDENGSALCVDLPTRAVRDDLGSASVLHVVGVPQDRCSTDTGGICEVVDGEAEIVRVVQDHVAAADMPGDVVVLAATRAELDEIQTALEDAFVPTARLERKPLAGVAEARIPALLAMARAHTSGAWTEEDALAVASDPQAVSKAVALAMEGRMPLGTVLDAALASVRSFIDVAAFPGWSRWTSATSDPWPTLLSVAGGDETSALREWLAAESESRREAGIMSLPSPADMLTWLASDEAQRPTREPHAVCLATFHASKGLEWPRVVVVGACDGANPPKFARTPKDAADWHRAFYVACTRARDHLTVIRPEYVRGKLRGTNELLARAGLDIEDSGV